MREYRRQSGVGFHQNQRLGKRPLTSAPGGCDVAVAVVASVEVAAVVVDSVCVAFQDYKVVRLPGQVLRFVAGIGRLKGCNGMIFAGVGDTNLRNTVCSVRGYVVEILIASSPRIGWISSGCGFTFCTIPVSL